MVDPVRILHLGDQLTAIEIPDQKRGVSPRKDFVAGQFNGTLHFAGVARKDASLLAGYFVPNT